MVNTRKKMINGKRYLYAEHSFRLPDQSVKKISKFVRDESDAGKLRDYFIEKEIEANQAFALKRYRTDHVFTKEKIKKLERIRIQYKYMMGKLPRLQMKDLLDRFTVNFTYESNALEGNSLTLKDVTMLLAENLAPEGKDMRDIFETRNTREAHEELFKGRIKLTREGIIKLHSILVKETGVASGFKRFPNYLVMRNVKTTPPEKVERELSKVIDEYGSGLLDTHPLKLVAYFHAAFERIHPFEDGNGRVGRVLINAMLLRNGYPPLIIRKTHRHPYFSALDAADNGHMPKLERFMIEKLEKTFGKFFGVYMKYL